MIKLPISYYRMAPRDVYVLNVIIEFLKIYFQAGIKDDGKGAIYHYDPVGSMEELTHSAGGAAVCLVQPFLDNQVGKNNRTDKGDEGEMHKRWLLSFNILLCVSKSVMKLFIKILFWISESILN